MRLEACARRTLRVPAHFHLFGSPTCIWSSYIYVREIRTLSAISPENHTVIYKLFEPNLDDEIVFYPVYASSTSI